jgi:hypothetical protein
LELEPARPVLQAEPPAAPQTVLVSWNAESA